MPEAKIDLDIDKNMKGTIIIVYDQEKFEQKLVNRVTHSLLLMVEGTGQIVPLRIAFDQK
jgi:hypothetical protein